MAADIEQSVSSETKRKRKRVDNKPKLLVDTNVEVRSVDDGFLGSWHSGTVIACEELARRVRYDRLLCDDGSENLIESIRVLSIVDGMVQNRKIYNYRGLIRPIPPPLDFQKWNLHYGQCVDVYYQEAWWEGVIFDHEDGAELRKIFFPDIGDEMEIGTDMLRITQDWDEFTENWTPRGNWLFLELIEEFEQEWPLLVSVKQIWYDVRGKKGFWKLSEWTCPVRDLWRSLVLEVISDNLKLTSMDFFVKLNPSELLVDEPQKLLESSEPVDDLGNSLALVTVEHKTELLPENTNNAMDNGKLDLDFCTTPIMPCNNGAELSVLPSSPSSLDEFSSISSSSNSEGLSSTSSETSNKKRKYSKIRTPQIWLPAGQDLVPEPKFCPDAFTHFRSFSNSRKKPPNDLMLNVRNHLAYMGWKIEHNGEKRVHRLRYTSPRGKSYASLRKLSQEFTEAKLHLLSAVPHDGKKVSSADLLLLSAVPHNEKKVSSTDVVTVRQPKARKKSKGKSFRRSPNDIVIVEAEHCPQAVMDYYSLSLKGTKRDSKFRALMLKAKKHLSSVGWSFWYIPKNGRCELRYTSPNGRCYISLLRACKGFIDEGGVSDCGASVYSPLQVINASEEGEDQLNAKIPRIRGVGKKRKNGKLQFSSDGDCPTRVLRSRKRARDVVGSSSSHHTPRTVLSWLIDNNVVLPRQKVHYYARKDCGHMAEGKITRDGIKCSCCQNVFTLTKFEAHAGSTLHRPAAHIFLEDGRSLLDCQRELKRNNYTRSFTTEPHEMKGKRHHSRNDDICSVCHFGGELVLCDQCPSSFHTHCLGLKDVPAGDWFCSSCCCGICGQSACEKDPENFVDDSVLNCDQCEHQYHVGCLRKRGLINLDHRPKGSWFCDIRCEQIWLGLHKLLGEAVPLGKDNLTWTLMKYVRYQSDHGASDIDSLTENYSKLNVALGVMHECFEPVKESRTRRDLVEDVIFSRWSELNRLNFRGFYTVLLERNDELITVASVRVHGQKLAEVPLVATRFQYRRLGMCGILMNELEKKLIELGVERLVLPAIPSVLNSWTTSFGFSKMAETERLKYKDYTFLDFQGTVMCQKLLLDIPSTDSSILKEIQQKSSDDVNRRDNVELDGNSAVSEVFQANQTDENEIVEQEPLDAGSFGSSNGSNVSPPLVDVVSEPTCPESVPFQSEIGLVCSIEDADRNEGDSNGNGLVKFYTRRRTSACGS